MSVQGGSFSLDSSGKASRSGLGAGRKTLLIGTSLLVYTAFPSTAMAQQECGVPPPEGVVSCPASGNPYPAGISYPGNVEDLTIVLEPGVVSNGSVSATSTTGGVDLRIEAQNTTLVATTQTGVTGIGVNLSSTAGSVYAGMDD